MIGDIWTVMWKEGHEYVAGASGSGSGRGRGILGVLLIIGIISILLPLQLGTKWFGTAAPVIVDGAFLPYVILVNIIADSFAGERERHTLETLLASRLSDRAILLGKIGAAVLYGWSVSLVGAVVQAIIVNLKAGGAGLTFYPAVTALSIVVVGLLMSLLVASLGCLVSLRAGTTRQAQQVLGIGFFLVVLVVVFGLQLLPADLWAHILAASASQLLLGGSLILLAIDVVLILTALALFQRAKLILN